MRQTMKMIKSRKTTSPSEYHRQLGVQMYYHFKLGVLAGRLSRLEALQRKPRVKHIFIKDYIPYNLKEKPSVRFEMLEYLGSDEDDYR